MSPRRSLGLIACLLACDATPGQAPETPEAPKTDWHVCATEGAIRRLRCPPSFEPCVMRANALSLECYRQVHRAHEGLPPTADLSVLGPHWAYQARIRVLGPDGQWWFGKPGDPNYVTPYQWSQQECAQLPKLPPTACIAELRFGIESVRYGGFGAERQ